MRDDFSQGTIEMLAKRAGYLCSNPKCGQPTVGAAPSQDKFINVGVAAHITAAAPGGPRYDPLLTREQRQHQSNGIWLCQTHAKMVDSDPKHFTVEMLREWKQKVENKSFRAIVSLEPGRNQEFANEISETADDGLIQRLNLPPQDDLLSVTQRLVGAARVDLDAFKRTPGWPLHAIALNLRINDGKSIRSFDITALATAIGTFNEIVVVAPPGTGKTTTLLQMAEAILSRGDLIAVFVPLGEWSAQSDSLFQSIVRRHSFVGTREEHLKLLAHSGRLVLVMDGWNELDASSRKRASTEIKGLQREFPGLSVIVSTRRQALDVPISGPIVEIDTLTEDQQLEIARALRSAQGEAILDHAWRTSGIRELVAIPLYLATLLAHTPGATLPTTKEEVLRLFVKEHERVSDKAETLRETLFGFHTEALRALAIEATRSGSTALSDNKARAVVKSVEDQLVTDGQITSAPQPTMVIDILVSHHLLVRAEGASGGLSFQHQQFQEWYASLEVETLMRASAANDGDGRRNLRVNVLNSYAWEEPILFACERMSRGDESGVQAVATSILEAIGIDPILAAEMIYRSTPAVWDRIKDKIEDFVRRWHTSEKVDRAVRFMITTGRSEFASQIWPLISSLDSNVYLSVFRAARRFRPSVLGTDIQARITQFPEEQREHIISEIAMESGIDGIELAMKLGQADVSAMVQASVIEALQFRRADRFVLDILRSAPDEVWGLLARKGYAEEIRDPDAVARFRLEQNKMIEAATDPLGKLRELLNAARGGLSLGHEVGSTIENADFPVRDQQAGWIIAEAHKLYPNDVATALVHRLEAGLEIPCRSEDILRAANIVIDEGPLVDIVIQAETPQNVAIAASSIVGPETVGKLIDLLVPLNSVLKVPEPPASEATRKQYHQLIDRVSGTGATSFVKAVLSQAGTVKTDEIALLADLISRHGKRDEQSQLRVSSPLYEELVATVGRWAEILLISDSSSRSQLADIARVIERLAAPELLPVLQRMLTEDLARWRRTREEFLAALNKGVRINSDAQHSWTLQYRRAFAAIGNDAVVEMMKAYLPDFGFYGFSIDAAHVLKEIWERRTKPPKERGLVFGPDFSVVKTRRMERQSQAGGRNSSPFADAILGVVSDLTKPGSSDDAHKSALELANIALSMPYGEKRTTIDTLLQLRQPLRTKQMLLTTLVLAGEVVQSDTVLDNIKSFLEESKTKQRLSNDERWSELEGWFMLIPFTDRPYATLEALELLAPNQPQPWRLRRLLSALGYSPSAEAEELLKVLPRKDAGFLTEHDWLTALEKRGTAVAARTLFGFICEGAFAGKPGGVDAWTLSRKLAAGIRVDAGFRAEVYQRYEREPSGAGTDIIEHAISEAADADGVLVLVRNHALQGKPFSGVLNSAIRHVAVGERPSTDWTGAIEVFRVGVAQLRKQLFRMIKGDTAETSLVTACLIAIDELRDEYGPAESEPRHPDIDSGCPWPETTG